MATLFALGAVALVAFLNRELRADIRSMREDIDGLRREVWRRQRFENEAATAVAAPDADAVPSVVAMPEAAATPEPDAVPGSAEVPEADSAPQAGAATPADVASDVPPAPAAVPAPKLVMSDEEFELLSRFLSRRQELPEEVRERAEAQLVTRFGARIPREGRTPLEYLSDVRRDAAAQRSSGAVPHAPASRTTPAPRPRRYATPQAGTDSDPSHEPGPHAEPESPPRRDPEPESGPEPRPEREPEPTREPAGVGSGAQATMDFETRVGTTWTLRIGLAAIAIAGALFARTIMPQLPAGAKVALAYSGALLLFGVGRVYEPKLERFARPVMAGGLSLAFFVSFAAYFVPAMRAVPMVVSLAWMTAGVIAILVLATRWESQQTAGLAIFLGHVSAFVAAGDADGYSLVLIAFLSITAVVLWHRNSWAPLSIFAVVAAYASHLLWALVAQDTLPAARALPLNLMFLTSYYAIFLAADVLWWRRRADAPDELDDGSVLASIRTLGPANLVFFVSLASYFYVATSSGQANGIEWFFFSVAAVQGILGLAYRKLENPDHGFYAMLAIILVTLGYFAAFEALALNLVLAAQALILLIAAHRTRMRVFHLLAQMALLVNFIHYWMVVRPENVSLAVFLGGFAIVGVYFTKSQLEEIWYGSGEGRWSGAGEPPAALRGISQAFDEAFGAIAPWVAHLHAVAGALILMREVHAYFPPGPALGFGVAALVVLALGSALRRSVPLALAYFTVQIGASMFALAFGPESLFGRMGVVAVGFALPSFLAMMAPRRFDGAARETVLGISHAALWLALILPFSLVTPAVVAMSVLGQYLLWIGVAALVFVYAELRAGPEESILSAEVSFAEVAVIVTATLGAVLVTFVTDRILGVVLAAPLWVSVWTVALLASSGWRRSRALYAAGFTLLASTYLYFLVGRELGPDVAASAGASALVFGVPLLMAVEQDRRAPRDAVRPQRRLIDFVTYVPYAFASIFLFFVLFERVGIPWAVPVRMIFPIALLLAATRLALPRAAVVALVVTFLSVLQQAAELGLIQQTIQFGEPGSVTPLGVGLLVVLATVIVERLATHHYRETWPDVRWVSLALVIAATGLAFVAVARSSELGAVGTTAGWSVIAAAMMVLGFVWGSANYRRVALAAFAVSLIRVVVVDVRGLSSGGQTLAFLVLGVLLVAVAWLYARFSAQLRKWL